MIINMTNISHLIKFGSVAEHPWGLALYEPTKKLCYVMIPKNATTTFNKLSVPRGWQFINYLDFAYPVDRYIVVLRDPVDRLISGLNMFITRDTCSERTVLRPGAFYTEDCHFEKQHKFIRHLSHDQIDFFYFNHNVVSEIDSHYNLGFDQILHNNRSVKLVTDLNKRAVKYMYLEDMALIQSVQFVNITS
jgi:hypothetical protein